MTIDDRPLDTDLDDRLQRLLDERADGVTASPNLHQILTGADRSPASSGRTRLFYVASVAAAVLAAIAVIGVAGLVGDDPAAQEPTDQRLEPSTTTTQANRSSLSLSTTTVPSTSTEQQPADCPPGQHPFEDGCSPPSTTTTTGVVTSSATMPSTTVDG